MTRHSVGHGPVQLVCATKRFDHAGGAGPVLDRVSFRGEAGRLHLFLGPSGSGKTTLLTLMAGLQRPSSGEVRLFGRNLSDYAPRALQALRARSIGFVFQDFQLIDFLDVFENIALVLRFARCSHTEVRRRVEALLEQFDLAHLRTRRPTRLSQGEKQRVAVARAVANRALLVLADEPTASLESSQGLAVIHLLRDYAQTQGHCVIVASHDLRLAEYADTVQQLNDGVLGAWRRPSIPFAIGRSARHVVASAGDAWPVGGTEVAG